MPYNKAEMPMVEKDQKFRTALKRQEIVYDFQTEINETFCESQKVLYD